MSRWKGYLLLVLLCMAGLFYWETEQQQQANAKIQQYLQQWLQDNHAQVSSSSYHVLRNRLDLQQLNLDWQRMHISSEYTGVLLDQSNHNRLHSLVLRQLKIALDEVTPAQLNLQLHQLLQNITSLNIEQGQVYLATETWLDAINLQLKSITKDKKVLQGSLNIDEGHVSFHIGWQKDGWSSLKLQWQHTNISHVLRHFNAPQLFDAPSNGEITWHKEAGTSLMHASITQGSSHLTVSGEKQQETWVFQLSANKFNLKNIAFYVPKIFSHTYSAGVLNGEMQATWHTASQDWTLNSSELLLEDLQFNDVLQHIWNFSSIRIQELKLAPFDFDIAKLWLKKTRIDIVPNTFTPTKNRLQAWKGEIRAINVDHLNLNAVMPEATFNMPSLFGRGSLHHGKLTFDLQHLAQTERWRLHGNWDVFETLMHANISVKGASLAQFRHVLSQVWHHKTQDSTELMGDVDLDMQLLADTSVMRLKGDLQVQNLHVSQFGHQLQASTLHMKVNQIGWGLTQQSIKHIKIKDWNYQFALSPITTPIYQLAEQQHYLWNNWKIGSLTMQKGSISVARRDAQWLTDVHVQLEEDTAHNDDMSLRITGQMAQKTLHISGTVSPFAPQPSFDIKASLNDVLPFFLNEWLQLSGIPHLIQGRVSSFLHVYRDTLRQEYRGTLKLRLNQPVFASGTFANDPFIALTGFSLQDVIQRMAQQGIWRLEVPLQIPDEYVFNQDVIGKAVIQAMKQGLKTSKNNNINTTKILMEQAIRLHEAGHKDQLSLNERVRIKKIAQTLAQHSDAIVILRPQLGNQTLNPILQQQIEYTQTRIGRLLRYKGVTDARIFPVWPGAAHRQGDVGGIQVLVQKVDKE